MANPLEKIPPQNLDAERSLLGCLLIDRDAMIRVADAVAIDDFYLDSHRAIFEAAFELFRRHEPIDLLSLGNRLEERKQLEAVGGRTYLITLANTVVTASNVAHYAAIVQKKATLRRLIVASSEISGMGYDESEEVENILDHAEQKLFGVSQKYLKQAFVPIKEVLEDAFERIDELHREKGKLRGISTGFAELDSLLAGLQKSDLVILAARPSVGKTSLALDIARHASTRSKIPVGIFSLEMSKEQLTDRLICAEAGIDLWRMRTGRLSETPGNDDFGRIGHALGVLSEAPIYIDDSATSSVMEIRTKARRLQMEQGLGLLIVDYLQLMESRTKIENRVLEISEITRSLKGIARELNIPVLALSQLSRAVEMSKPAIPKLAHLRESGCLAGETLIMRADTGALVSIRELAERDNQEPIPVFALDHNWKVVVRPLVRAFPSGKKRIYELITRSGRRIRASANHPFRRLEGWRRLDMLRVGDRIAIPRQLTPNAATNSMSEDELVLLAHLVGDGCTVPNQPIHYTSADQENLATVARLAERRFGIKPRLVKQENWWHLYLPSPYRLARGKHNPITEWLTELGVGLRRAPEKIIPRAVFSCDEERVALFLRHLWATDGNLSWKRLPNRKPAAAIYYASSSENLSRGVQHLLLRLGIPSTIRTVPQGQYRPMHHVHVEGSIAQIDFLERVGCAGSRGAIVPDLLTALRQITPNPNTDVIPREAWKISITPAKERMEWGWRDVSRAIDTSYCGSTLFKAGIGRERMGRLAVALHDTTLKNLALSDIFWDEIISIAPQGIEDVFDATVPGVHNFVANDLIVHNSIEQDSDVVMFIYRKAADRGYQTNELAPDERRTAEIHIAKHRNGPTGVVRLFFDEARTSFKNLETKFAPPSVPAQKVQTPTPF